VGVKIIYLCGVTPTPDHPKLSKASLGAEWSVAWQYSSNVVSTVNNLKDSGKRIYCLEETATSKSIFELNTDMNPQPNVLIVGNEITGIDPAILEMCDQVVDIPMLGYKRSLNVAVAFGIAIYQFRMHISK
jgi:tRNA G18 (ribose-2'-O)-methylase SpoU